MDNFEILVLGDGAYVFAVLNAVSSIDSYGVLGAIGALIGLLLAAVKGIQAPGGPKIEPHWILLSFVIFYVMFVPRIDQVIISELSAQPGDVTPRSFVVDNVPLGLAAGGFIVSKLGSSLTLTYETAFGSAEDEARGTTGGLGRNLMVMAQLRTMMSNPNFSDPAATPNGTGYLGALRENMTEYLRSCTYPMVNNGVLSRQSVMNSPGLSGAINDFTANALRPMRWRTPTGYENSNCAQAKDRIYANVESDRILTAFDAAMKANGSGTTSRELQAAFGTFANLNGVQMQTMVATSMLNAVAAEAAVRGSLTPAETQSVIMVEEAASRRNAQWGAEESLFIRILRPIVGFFEALFYALGPIMAFVATMGPFGWAMVGKYLMLTVWVGLWFPMLAITQLYSNVQMKYFFERLGNSGEHYTPNEVMQIAAQAMDALGAASALTAATPALAMSLLYGGAVSMSYLAGRLQGGDMVDEGKVSPNASSVGPVAMLSAGASGSTAGGTALTGASMKSITAGESLQRQQAAAEQWVESSGAKLSHMLTEGVARKDGTTMSGGEMVAAGWSESQTAAFQNMINRMESEGTISEEDAAFARKMDQAQMARASVAASATVGTPLGGIVGSNASVTGKVEGAGTSTASESDTKTLSVAHSLQKAVQASDSESRAVQDVLTKSTQNFLNTSHSSSVEATDAESLSKAAEQSRVASQSYGDSVTRSSGISSTQSATFDQVEQNFHDRYGAGAQNEIDNLRSLAYGAGLGDDYETALRSHMSHGGLNSSQAEVAALFDTFNSATVTNDNADEIAKGMGTLTDTAFNNYSSGNVQARADLDGSTVREDVTAATRHVAGATSAAQTIDGPGLSAGDIRGDVAGGMSAAQTGIDNVSIEDPGADGKILPSESQGASAAAARQDVNDTYSRNEGVIDDKANDFISKSARVTVAGHHQE